MVLTGVWDPRLGSPQIDERRESFIPAVVRETDQKSDYSRILSISKNFYFCKDSRKGKYEDWG